MSKYPSIKKPSVEIDFNDDHIYLNVWRNDYGVVDTMFNSAVVMEEMHVVIKEAKEILKGI